jgi:hypothetical protein
MNRRTIGLAMVGVGLVMIIAGVLTLGGDDPEPVASPTTTTAAPAATTTTTAAATTTVAPTTTTSTTTTTTTTTTTATTSTTTTTTTPPPSVEEFIAAYAAATEAGDADFLFERLLPQLRDAFGSDLCRAWVEREIVAISGYQLTGTVSGPQDRTLTVGETSIPTSEYYEGPVAFTFQGEPFDTTAQWVVQDGRVYWIGVCR